MVGLILVVLLSCLHTVYPGHGLVFQEDGTFGSVYSCLFFFTVFRNHLVLFFTFRWKESTLTNPLHVAKTTWPVPYIEALFLPEFQVKGFVTEASFQVTF